MYTSSLPFDLPLELIRDSSSTATLTRLFLPNHSTVTASVKEICAALGTTTRVFSIRGCRRANFGLQWIRKGSLT